MGGACGRCNMGAPKVPFRYLHKLGCKRLSAASEACCRLAILFSAAGRERVSQASPLLPVR